MSYAALVLDLDGVVYIGDAAVPHAIASLNALAATGVTLTAATNNANRPATRVAAHLQQLGLKISPEHVMTSAQAAARHVAARFGAGAAVLAVGGDGVAIALEQESLRPMRASEDLAAASATADRADAVVIGYGPRVAWFDLATAHWAIERGTPWFATNSDPTVPLPFGRAPGNGAMVGLLERSTGIAPTVIGKPQPALFEAIAAQLQTRRLLVIGDRLDTDVDGAIACGLDSLFVLTGVHGLRDLAERPLERWPSYIAADLRALLAPPLDLPSELVGPLSGQPLVSAIQCAATGHVGQLRTEWPADSPMIDVRGLRRGSVST